MECIKVDADGMVNVEEAVVVEVNFRNDLKVELIDHMGTDDTVVRSARVSMGNDDKNMSPKGKAGLINYLVSNGHVSTLEHCFVTFRIEAPIFVAREMVTHKGSGLHWNEISGRYSRLEPDFYMPSVERPVKQAGTSAHPNLVDGGTELYRHVVEEHTDAYEAAWGRYEYMLNAGVANEVARNVLPVGVYTRWYASATLREWLHILEMRTAGNAQWEIRQIAKKILDILRELYPIVIEKWEKTLEGHVSDTKGAE